MATHILGRDRVFQKTLLTQILRIITQMELTGMKHL